MITGLLFTLTQKPLEIANDSKSDALKGEGRHFPPAPIKKVKAPYDIVRLTRVISLVLTVFGVGLLCLGSLNWSFDPALGLNIQTAGLCFTLPVGVFS